jgi:hypothetical protein
MSSDIPETVAYGANCRWWDDKRNVSTLPNGLPCCPHCNGVLFETDGKTWFEQAKEYEEKGHTGYVEHLHSIRGKCDRCRCTLTPKE